MSIEQGPERPCRICVELRNLRTRSFSVPLRLWVSVPRSHRPYGFGGWPSIFPRSILKSFGHCVSRSRATSGGSYFAGSISVSRVACSGCCSRGSRAVRERIHAPAVSLGGATPAAAAFSSISRIGGVASAAAALRAEKRKRRKAGRFAFQGLKAPGNDRTPCRAKTVPATRPVW